MCPPVGESLFTRSPALQDRRGLSLVVCFDIGAGCAAIQIWGNIYDLSLKAARRGDTFIGDIVLVE